MRGVVQHAQSVPGGERGHRIVIAQDAVVIHDDDRPRARRNQFLRLRQVDAKGGIVDVAEYRPRPGRDDRLKIGRVVERRRDHLVARTDTHEQQGKMQGRVTGADGDDVTIRRADARPQFLLELADITAHAQPAVFQRGTAGLEFFRFDQRLKYRDHGLFHHASRCSGMQALERRNARLERSDIDSRSRLIKQVHRACHGIFSANGHRQAEPVIWANRTFSGQSVELITRGTGNGTMNRPPALAYSCCCATISSAKFQASSSR